MINHNAPNILTALEIDALTEIDIGCAANSLNQMVSQTVDLTIPNKEILPNIFLYARLIPLICPYYPCKKGNEKSFKSKRN